MGWDPEATGTRGRLDRRTLLTTGVALAAGLAGCSGLGRQRYEATPASLAAAAGEMGYELLEADTREFSESRTVGGRELSLTVISHAARYERSGDLPVEFGVAATPRAERAGQTLNPVADASVADLVGGEVGRQYLDEDSSLAGREWSRGPERVDTTTATTLGTETTVETYVGVSDGDLAVVSAAKVEDGDDAVLAGGSHSPDVPAPADGSPLVGDGGVSRSTVESQTDLVAGTLPTVVRETAVELGSSGSGTLDLADVPVEYHRRAAKHVVEANGTRTVRGAWTRARLDGHVRPLYRPDVDGVAYYEFGVDPDGFVVVTAGEHDYPVPHWNFVRDPPTVELAEEADREVERFYKMDALYHVAEADGEMVAEWGTRLSKIEGVDESALDREHERIVREYGPVDPEAEPRDLEFETLTSEGPDELTWEYGEFESWDEMKAGYDDSFGAHNEALRRQAREDWSFMNELDERGIGLLPDETRRVPLLFEDAEYELTGPGAAFVETREVEGAVRLTVADVGEERAPFSLEVEYGNGTTESIDYALPSPSTLETVREREGGVAGTLAGQPAAATGGLEGALATGGWDYSWAGGPGLQRAYQQFQHDGCAVGCGPVAWAMLFGWADVRADDGSAKWSRQSGLFREDGGTWPENDIRAPKNVTRGNAAMNVIEELNGTLGTFCLFGGGATIPSKMARAWQFGRNRAPVWCWFWGNDTMFTKKWIRNKARNIIEQTNTPSIIGTGLPKHYPVAYGYAHKSERKGWGPWRRTVHHRSFYCNQGHGDVRSGWVNGTSWAAGLAHPSSVDV